MPLDPTTQALAMAGYVQFLSIWRYDDTPDCSINTLTWPYLINEEGWETGKWIGWTDDPNINFDVLMRDCGYVATPYAELPEELRQHIHNMLIPFEWKNHMDTLGTRVKLYHKGPLAPTRQGTDDEGDPILANLDALEANLKAFEDRMKTLWGLS